ncbi:hypothetical protein BGZ51_004931 [Haplosporangium sp. Z 767]|nr:hypothetical protein BGZ51_004931 [Haplosporangium sp. Z 767]
MVDTQLLMPALLPQEPRLQLLAERQDILQEQQQPSVSSAYHHHQYHHRHHHQDQQGQDLHSTQANVQFHHHDQDQQHQLQDMTHEFLLQEMTNDPTGIGQGSPSEVMQHPSPTSEAEEELNIYDYIHAKQEDEDDAEDHGLDHHGFGHADSRSSMIRHDVVDLRKSSTSNDGPHHYSLPSPSSPTPSATSYSSPSSPSLSTASAASPMRYDHTSTDILADAYQMSCQDEEKIKLEIMDDTLSLHGHEHDGYMNASMDLYGSDGSSLLPSQVDATPSSTQDLFRMLMDELQTQAAIQRDKFFSATTGSDTGMDSVEFLFNGQQQQQQQQSQLPMQTQQFHISTPSKSLPHFMTETSTDVNMDSAATTARSEDFPGTESDLLATENQSPEPSSIIDVPARVPTLSEVSVESLSSMESTMSSSDPTSSYSSSEASKSEVVHVAFTRIANRSSKAAVKATQLQPQFQQSKPHVNIAPRSSRSLKASTSPEMSFQSVIEQHNAKERATRDATKNESTTKRRKLSVDQDALPVENALPSPPSSVKTSPPMQAMAMDLPLGVDTMDLPPASIDENPSATVSFGTTPSSSERTPKRKRSNDSSGSVEYSMESKMDASVNSSAQVSVSTTVPISIKKTLVPNANNKRPWTSEEEKLLLKLVDDAVPIKEIAATLDRSVHSVRSRRQILTDPGFVKGNGHAQPRRAKPDPSSKLPTYSQMAFLSLARLSEREGTLNDVASMVEQLFSRYLNRIPRTGHKNLQIWRAQISDALAHEKGHPRPRFESFGVKRGRQWVYRLTKYGRGIMEAMGGVEGICDDLLKDNAMVGSNRGPNGEILGGAEAGLGQGQGYGYSYSPDSVSTPTDSSSSKSPSTSGEESSKSSSQGDQADSMIASSAITRALAAMAAGQAAMAAVEDGKSATVVVIEAAPSVSATTMHDASKAVSTGAKEKVRKGSKAPSEG